jgi:LysR family glycine cleavage system transcriptional activator
MTYRLPPLNALRAFEAAARHLSFKDASAELSVTPTAISHQIRGLEEYLGFDLSSLDAGAGTDARRPGDAAEGA